MLCDSQGFNPHYASVYLSAIDFVSIRYLKVTSSTMAGLTNEFISVALYGLIIFYGLTKSELEGKRPLAKFLTIKLIVMFTFYQFFVVSTVTALFGTLNNCVI